MAASLRTPTLTSLESQSRRQRLEAKCFLFTLSLSSTIPTDLQEASGYIDTLGSGSVSSILGGLRAGTNPVVHCYYKQTYHSSCNRSRYPFRSKQRTPGPSPEADDIVSPGRERNGRKPCAIEYLISLAGDPLPHVLSEPACKSTSTCTYFFLLYCLSQPCLR